MAMATYPPPPPYYRLYNEYLQNRRQSPLRISKGIILMTFFQAWKKKEHDSYTQRDQTLTRATLIHILELQIQCRKQAVEDIKRRREEAQRLITESLRTLDGHEPK